VFSRTHAVETNQGEKIPTIEIMEQWAKVILEFKLKFVVTKIFLGYFRKRRGSKYTCS
jgi:hypothetical protein